MRRMSAMALFALVLVGLTSPVLSSVMVDIDGAGTMFSSHQLSPNGLIDLDEGNMVVIGARPLLLGILPPPGTMFQAYFQTSMTNVVYDDGTLEALPTFSFPPFFTSQEITAQFALPMLFTGFDGLGRLNLEVAPVGPNFAKFYYDAPKDASIPLGSGFGDGTNILTGTFTSLDFAVAPTLLSASTFEATVHVTSTDPAFFSVPMGFTFLIRMDLDGLVKIPPQIPLSASIVGYAPTGSDLLASLDLTAKIIPEASSLVLVGLLVMGSAGYGAYRRRRSA